MLSKGQSKPLQSPTSPAGTDASTTPSANSRQQQYQADHMNYSAQQHTGNQSAEGVSLDLDSSPDSVQFLAGLRLQLLGLRLGLEGSGLGLSSSIKESFVKSTY